MERVSGRIPATLSRDFSLTDKINIYITMTLKEIKSELKHGRWKAITAIAEAEYYLSASDAAHHLTKEETLEEVIELLNKLSPPPLKWVQVNPFTYTADTPVGKYNVSLVDGDWNCIQEHGLFVSFGFAAGASAESAAELHWEELYRKIINL